MLEQMMEILNTMKVITEVNLKDGKIEIITKKEHKFSELQMKILNILALDGYYEIRHVPESNDEYDAVQELIKLGLVEENMDAWHYTVKVSRDENVMALFKQIRGEIV